MKRIVNGRRFDTDAPGTERVASYRNTPDLGDHHHYSEELYRTRAGGWFLVGEGGPASKYRRTVAQNEWSSGEELRPLTDEQARAWLEEHEKTQELEKYFGAEITDA